MFKNHVIANSLGRRMRSEVYDPEIPVVRRAINAAALRMVRIINWCRLMEFHETDVANGCM
jgi:hypothetical protein